MALGGLFLSGFFAAHPIETQVVFGGVLPPVLGGPAIAATPTIGAGDALVAALTIPDEIAPAQSADELAGFIFVSEAALIGSANPLISSLPSRDGTFTYTVAKGDTLSGVAAQFGISLNTLIWANQDMPVNAIKPGAKLVVLPVSGVRYAVREGDSIESLVALYGVSAEQILKYNKGVSYAGITQDVVIIPGARPQKSASLTRTNLPNRDNEYVAPAKGYVFKTIHADNAIDVANVCGEPVYAAAEGLVIEAGFGWNGGFGNHVRLKHSNSTETHYAHLKEIFVRVGDFIGQGQQLGTIGNTGLVDGVTGCHLHFGIEGARNFLGF